ncbi:unnamed protein product [Hermetia illucens]|uniref:Cilia- and flagella-associated protein 58 central coiled coil domain-containing protein n=1 Tax=Hermetia illucens TaxID=343691 RepID=A0A7R8UZE0_HERIL|nr:cilia- and flagella-associated protein 58-like [Hermetia illucens]CAD7089959.1 unnamed protein product [Hermetia illucens]
MVPKPLTEKSEKDRVAFEIDKKNENPEETEQDELSIPDLSPFDRVITNADLAAQALIQEEKHMLANQVGKLVDYCYILKADLEKKQQEIEELMPKIGEANDRMTQAMNVSLTSERTVQILQVALGKAWGEVDASRLREQTMQEQMSEMYAKLTTLEGKLKKTQKTEGMGEMTDVGPLANKKETILRERDRLQAEVEELDKRLHMQRLYSENVEKFRQDAEAVNTTLMQELESSDTDKVKFKRRIQDLHLSIEKAKDTNLGLTKRINSLENRIEDYQKQLEAKTFELQNMRLQFEKMKSEQASWNATLVKRSAALNTCTQENRSLSEQLRTILNKLKAKEYEVLEIRRDCKKSVANFDLVVSRLNKMSNARSNLNKSIVILKNEISNLQKEITLNIKVIAEERHEKDSVIHERDSLRSSIAKLTNVKRDLEHSIMLKNNAIERFQDDINKKNNKLDELKQNFDLIVKERDLKAQEIEVLNDKVDDLQESLTLKTEQIIDLKNKAIEKHALYMKTKQILETTNSERLVLRQQLQACTEEKDNIKTQAAHVSYQISQLKEEISNYQNNILTLNLEIEKLSKEKQELKMEIRNKTSVLNNIRNELKDTKKENDHLYKTLSVDEIRLMKQAIKLDNTMHEKDLIGSQMIRRNNEIVLLKEQISILDIALQRGQMQYNHRIEDIKLLKLEVMRLRSQRNVLTRGLANTVDMRHEVVQLNRLLLQERVTNTALKEEAVSPMNIHRWRPLAGRDPEKMDLIRKIIGLQRRMLKMQVQASKREQDLQQSHKLYILLKNYIEKLPSYKVKEDLVETQRMLKIRSRKLKAITAEMNTKEIEIKSRECVIENLKTTLKTSEIQINQLKKKALKIEDEKGQGKTQEELLPKRQTLGAGFRIEYQ